MDEMKPGEIARSLQRLERSQEKQIETLEEIKVQTTITNGRVTTLEREMKELKQRDHRPVVQPNEAKRATDSPDFITINIPASALSPKTIALTVAAILSGLIAAWKSGVWSN